MKLIISLGALLDQGYIYVIFCIKKEEVTKTHFSFFFLHSIKVDIGKGTLLLVWIYSIPQMLNYITERFRRFIVSALVYMDASPENRVQWGRLRRTYNNLLIFQRPRKEELYYSHWF